MEGSAAWPVIGNKDKAAETFERMTTLQDYINGLKLIYQNEHELVIEPGLCADDKSELRIKLSSPLTIDIEISGANGLDTGAEAINTWYYIWLIKNGANGEVRGLISLSPTSPVLPSNYSRKRRIGVVRNDAAGNFIVFKQFTYGNRRRYEIWYDMTGRRVIANGGNAAWTTINCLTLVPPTADVMWLNVLQTVTGVAANVRSMGNALDTGGKGRGLNSVNVSLFTNTQQFQYKNSIGGGSTWIEVCDYEEEV